MGEIQTHLDKAVQFVNITAVELNFSQLSHTLISPPLLSVFSPSVVLTTENSFANLTDNFFYLKESRRHRQKAWALLRLCRLHSLIMVYRIKGLLCVCLCVCLYLIPTKQFLRDSFLCFLSENPICATGLCEDISARSSVSCKTEILVLWSVQTHFPFLGVWKSRQ